MAGEPFRLTAEQGACPPRAPRGLMFSKKYFPNTEETIGASCVIVCQVSVNRMFSLSVLRAPAYHFW